jgi:hypothetical protein
MRHILVHFRTTLLISLLCMSGIDAMAAPTAQVPANTEDETMPHSYLMSEETYRRGAMLGTFIGFGVGHWIQGKPVAASIYGILELGTVGALIGLSSCNESDHATGCLGETVLMIPVVGGLILFKIIETIHLWSASYQPAIKQASLPVLPILAFEPREERVTLGLNFQF